MGWQRDDLEGHEGYVALVLEDGRTTSTTTGGGVVVRPATDADELAGYRITEWPATGARTAVVPWDQVVAWRVECECGWTGDKLHIGERRDGVEVRTGYLPAPSEHGARHCPEWIEDELCRPQWDEHVDGLAGLARLHELAAQARDVDQAIHDAVRNARRGGWSWADVARPLGITRQAAQQRFAPRGDQEDKALTRIADRIGISYNADDA